MTLEIDYLTDLPPLGNPITGAVNGVYSQNTEHEAEAISHLIEFFRSGPRNQAVLRAVMSQVQEVEDVLWYTRNAFNVETAVGEQLEFLGRRVGEERQDRSDSVYRATIKVRILVNMSEGTLPDLIAICEGINPAVALIINELWPAALYIEASSFGALSLQDAYRLLRPAKTCGVRLHLVSGGTLASLGSSDGSPLGGVLGSSDGSPAGFVMASGT